MGWIEPLIANKLFGGDDGGGGGGDSVARRPLGGLNPDKSLNSLSRYRSALDFESRGARRPGVMSYLQHAIDKLSSQLPEGTDASGVAGTVDFSDPNFDANAAQGLRGIFNQAVGRHINPSVFNKQIDQRRTGAQTEYDQGQWDQYGQPAFDQAQTTLEGLASQDALSATTIADQRSRIMATLKGNAESRLKQVAAGLGMSGADPSTPGGAMLAHAAALQGDAEMADSLTQYGIDSEHLNRENKTQTAALLTDLATKRLSVKSAFLAGDRAAMAQLSDSIGQILEAIRQTKEANALNADMMRQSSDQARTNAYIQGGTSLLGSVLGMGLSPGGFMRSPGVKSTPMPQPQPGGSPTYY